MKYLLKPEFAKQVADLYRDMESAYDQDCKSFGFFLLRLP